MTAAVVLVELNAGRIGGHWPDRLVRLATAAFEQGTPVYVAALLGTAPSTRRCLEQVGATIIDRPDRWDLMSRMLLVTGKALGYLSDFAGWAKPFRASKWQFTLLSWSLIEAASLRATAYRRPGAGSAYVVMTASGALHGWTKRVAGVAHLRIVHEMLAYEGRFLSWLSTIGLRGEAEVTAVCLTDAVADEHRARYPHVPVVVHELGLYAASDYIGEHERRAAREKYGVSDAEVVVSLVGGWWPYKDVDTIVRACHLVEERLRVIVAGTPLDDKILADLGSAPNVVVEILHHEVDTNEHREVYAAADFTIVARYAGVAKSSGLVTDTARMGVPLVISDHYAVLTATLSHRPWVRIFRASDADDLAHVIAGAAACHLARPLETEAAQLGLITSGAALTALIDTYARIVDQPAFKAVVSA